MAKAAVTIVNKLARESAVAMLPACVRAVDVDLMKKRSFNKAVASANQEAYTQYHPSRVVEIDYLLGNSKEDAAVAHSHDGRCARTDNCSKDGTDS
eukprot:jgi/Chlat1/5724/Chrsp38S05565